MIEILKRVSNRFLLAKLLLYPFVKLRKYILWEISKPKINVVNRLSELLDEDPVLKVYEFEGSFTLSPHSDLFKRIVLNGEYEPKLAQLCIRLLPKGKDVIDVGANIGFFTVLFAKNIHAQRVVAIEPTKNALARLYKNIDRNDVVDKVTVFEGVASSSVGVLQIKTICGKEEYSSLGEMEHPAISDENYVVEEVESITIDELVELYSIIPGIIKIDVEGAENLVFSGAQKVLKNFRPIIISELSNRLLTKNGSSSEQVISLIESFNYIVVDPLRPNEPIGKHDFGDILCIPSEASHLLTDLIGR